MKKLWLSFIILAAAVLVCSTAFASPWTPPNNVRIVQQSRAGTSNVFTTINDALLSITDASVSNPYLIKVMPGIYNEGIVMLKPHVTLEGSGQMNTIITGASSNADGGVCTVATVVMAQHSEIRNIKVVNTAPVNLQDYLPVAAISFNNAAARAEMVSVLTGSGAYVGGVTIGICTYGDAADAELDHVYVETHNNGNQSNPLVNMGGKMTVTDSRLAGFNNSGDVVVINTDNRLDPGVVTVINSRLEGTCPSCYAYGIEPDAGFDTIISNSSIALDSGNNTIFLTSAALNVENTKISVKGGASSYFVDNPGIVQIANSLLPGNRAGLGTAKLVNNHDEYYNPIPNQ